MRIRIRSRAKPPYYATCHVYTGLEVLQHEPVKRSYNCVHFCLSVRDNKRNASSDVAMAEVTSTINQTQRDSDVVSTEPNQASTIPVYSQVIKNRTKNENVYANPDDVTNLAAESAYEVNLDIQPSSNEDENETGLVDNILYDSSALKDESEMRNNDLNDEHVGALTTMEEQPGWVENIIYE